MCNKMYLLSHEFERKVDQVDMQNLQGIVTDFKR